MILKKACGNLLLSISKDMIKAGVASFMGIGVEEMPESMKKLR